VPELQASCAALTVVARNGTVKTSEYSWGFDDAPASVLRARFSLLGERPDDGRLELGFTDGRRTVDRDTEIAIELLCEHVYAAVQRIAARNEPEATGVRKLLQFRR
jgi:UDP-GlcNAc:undecaprenyl-phosphate GlcNAc-1-phosphate transferase